MARVKDILKTQKGIIHPLSGAGKTQSEIVIQIECSRSAILKITRRSNYGAKPNTIARDKCYINRILISKRFANCGKLSKALNSQRLRDSIISDMISKPLLTLKQIKSAQYGKVIIKIRQLMNGIRSSSMMKQDSKFASGIDRALVSG